MGHSNFGHPVLTKPRKDQEAAFISLVNTGKPKLECPNLFASVLTNINDLLIINPMIRKGIPHAVCGKTKLAVSKLKSLNVKALRVIILPEQNL